MKKYLFLLAAVVFLSGCANQSAVSGRGVTEEKTSAAPEQKNMENNVSQPNPEKFSDLVKDYKGAILKTTLGDIEVEFYSDVSPFTVNNFLNLAQMGFYDDTSFHRVIKDFMIQGGDPNSKDDNWDNDGQGNPGYKFADEFNKEKLVRGSLAMANSGPSTNGSQFFIVTAESTPWLDGKHTNFGKVIKGMDVVTKIEKLSVNENDHPTTDAKIESIELIKNK
jgi:peptidyl-prolyl cis-trans isomerase B (cyclophilin B)